MSAKKYMSKLNKINQAILLYVKEYKELATIQFLRDAARFFDNRLETENTRKDFMTLLYEYAKTVIEEVGYD